MIEALLRLMETPEAFTGPVNLGNPNECTVLELAKKVIALSGSKSKLVFVDLPQDDPRQRRPDISLAYEVLDWRPATGLEEGLERTIAYFDELLRSTPRAVATKPVLGDLRLQETSRRYSSAGTAG
jgi:UDP-glucuronate decarboxylase